MEIDGPTADVDALGDLNRLVDQPSAEVPKSLGGFEDVVDDKGEMTRTECAALRVGLQRSVVARSR